MNRFLADEKPGILAIKGEWGVGKTYSWNRYIKNYEPKRGQNAYAYVSLFGLKSVSELRHAIVAKHQPFNSGAKGLGQKSIREISNYIGNLKYGPIKNTEFFSDLIQDKLLNKFIVCIDDLERKEKTITTSSLLGFISSLREERDCYVVMLYNESELGKDDEKSETIKEYREKVFDREIVFDPSVEECASIIFERGFEPYLIDGQTNASPDIIFGSDGRGILRILEDGNVKNIRVIRKLKDALDYFTPEIKEKYPTFWPYFVSQTAKLLSLYYMHGEDFDLNGLVNESAWVDVLNDGNGDAEEMESYEKRAPIRKIGYTPEESDQILVEYLTNGYVNWSTYGDALEKWEKQHTASQSSSAATKVHSMLWSNFQANQEEFTCALQKLLKSHHSTISLQTFHRSIELLNELDESFNDTEHQKALDKDIQAFVEQNAEFDLTSMDFYGYPEPLVKRILTAAKKSVSNVGISESIERLSNSGGWNPSDLGYLSEKSSQDFYNWLKTCSTFGLLGQIKVFLSRFHNSDHGSQVAAELVSALHKIALRSKLDEIRVYQTIGLERPDAEGDQPEPNTGRPDPVH